ncbi:uncharacterized protein H6S33_008383 [Morchella sextelata]|uniref:uncharacterized protein n=1 Tax=Morchella sextelata TaxID=1174677 RepID=UPI001D04EAED|nr:uncharacterized protein H6S33_008383 [Morchella sextelata]KAH0602733.1 hypothetical protein H6S33_008383 [Morchella sextelata]
MQCMEGTQPGNESLFDLLEKLESLSGETVSKIDEAEERARVLKLELALVRAENMKLKEEAAKRDEENENLRKRNEELSARNKELEGRVPSG